MDVQRRMRYSFRPGKRTLDDANRISGDDAFIHRLEHFDGSVDVEENIVKSLGRSREIVKDRGQQYAGRE